MDKKLFESIKRGLEQAIAHEKGEITLPHITFETTWPECPSDCVHMKPALECEFKERCLVKLSEAENCRVGTPSRYTKG